MDPADMAQMILDGGASVLPWVAAGAGGGVALLLAFIGIRSGLRFFSDLSNERAYARSGDDMSDWEPSNSYEAYENGGQDGLDAYRAKNG